MLLWWSEGQRGTREKEGRGKKEEGGPYTHGHFSAAGWSAERVDAQIKSKRYQLKMATAKR